MKPDGWTPAMACAALAIGGCGTALSSFQPAHVPEQGHVHGEIGVDISYPTGTIPKVVDAAETVEEVAEQRALSEDEQRTILEGGAALAMDPPAAIPHVGAAYAPFPSWEVGIRLTTSGWRAAVRRQLLQQAEAGIDLTLGVGIGAALFTPPVESVLETLEVLEFSRWNFDVPVAIGRRGSWYRVWGGPRFMYSTLSQTIRLSLPRDVQVTGSVDGRGFYVGGHAGAALGYQSLFVGPELTLVKLVGEADVTALGLTETVEVDSFVIYPAFAVMGEF